MFKGWFRRRYYWYLRRDTVLKYQKLKRGECNRCGYCCGICPFLNRENNSCRIYHSRPEICKQYMLTPHDKEDNPDCGYYFIDEEELEDE